VCNKRQIQEVTVVVVKDLQLQYIKAGKLLDNVCCASRSKNLLNPLHDVSDCFFGMISGRVQNKHFSKKNKNF
jgi:hypothetical protein